MDWKDRKHTRQECIIASLASVLPPRMPHRIRGSLPTSPDLAD